MPTSDVTLYARWSECWNVTFDANGRAFERLENQTSYVETVVPGEYVNGGYWFIYNFNEGMMVSAWYDNPACDGEPVVTCRSSFSPTQDITLYAKWSEYWTVTLDGNGGHIYEQPDLTEEHIYVPKGEQMHFSPYMEPQNGMAFAGWYLNAEGTGEQIDLPSYVPTSDVTLYARWSECWNVTFDANGGYFWAWGDPDMHTLTVAVAKGQAVQESPGVDHPNGLAFVGWYLNAEGTGDQIDTWNYVPAGDVTFYAKWVPAETETWTVTFDFNGGYDPNSGDLIGTVEVVKGHHIDAWPADPIRDNADGMGFAGWYLDEACTGDPIDVGSYYPESDTTFYAKWVPGTQVTFDANGHMFEQLGKTTCTRFYPQGEGVFGETGFGFNSNEGLLVSGWYFDAACTQLAMERFGTYTPAGAVTLYAQWSPYWTVIFDANGGLFEYSSQPIETTVARGKNLEAWPPDPINSDAGLVFAGWCLNADGTGTCIADVGAYVPTADVTFYAKWAEDALVAEFNETNFPDATFRAYVSDNFDRNGDGILTSAEANAVTQINVRDMGIASLQGIENFTALQFLDCGCNNLTELDLSGNTALMFLDCDGNSITSLNVSGCTELESIFCGNNQLSVLDVSSNNRLENLHFNNNHGITSVDLSNKTALKQISAYATGLTSLDVSACSRVIQALENAAPSVAWDGHLDYELQVNGDEYVARIDPGLTVIGATPMAPNGYIVTFDANGGYIDGSSETTWFTFVSQGDELQNEPNVTNGDLAFAGWYLDTNFVGEPVFPWSYVPTGDVTFYAKWAEGVTLTLDANGGYFWSGETSWSARVAKGATSPVYGRGPGEPKRDDGQVFAGWYDNADCIGDPVDPWDYAPTYQTDVTFYAKWETRVSYTVTFDANGGYFDNNPNTVRRETLIEAGNQVWGNWYGEDYMTDERKVVVAWYYDAACTELAMNRFGMITVDHDVTLYAEWEDSVETTFDANGGYYFDDMSLTTLVYHDPINEAMQSHASSPRRNGHGFAGWYLNAECTGDPINVNTYVLTQDETFYAKWVEGDTYTVTFIANGGTFENGDTVYTVTNPVDQFFEDAQWPLFGKLVYPDGSKACVGWFADAEGTGSRARVYELTVDGTFYAKWSRLVTVTFDANGGCFNDDPDFIIDHGQFTVDRYWGWVMDEYYYHDLNGTLMTVEGWYYDPQCTEFALASDGALWGTGEDVQDYTLYAKWVPACTFSILANNGNTTTYQEEYAEYPVGTIISAWPNPFSYEGYAFTGWNTAADGSGTSYAEGDEIVLNGDLTLYAQWTESTGTFIITFDANGGYFGDDPTQTVYIDTGFRPGETIGTVAVQHNDPSMRFMGWYLDPECTEFVCFGEDGYEPRGDMTLYAKWVVGNVVTFDANGGQFYYDGDSFIGPAATRSFTVEAGETVSIDRYTVVHSDPHLALEGWYLDADLTQYAMGLNDAYEPTADVTLYAKWVDGWALTFNANGGYLNIDYYHTTSKTFSVIKGEAFETLIGCFNNEAVFLGWFLNADCTGDPVNENGFVPTQDTVLYAGWIPEVRVSINASNFPDDTFRGYIAANFDNGDGVLSDAEINAVTQINVREMGIASLQGIEYFTALQFLECRCNNLTQLDLSGNSALTCLDCDGNSITSLNVSGCTELDTIFCGNNQLTALDVSNNNRLENLHFNNNYGITSVDLSNKTALKQISAYATGLTSLDVSACSRVIQALENATPSVAWDGHLDYELQVNDDEYVARIDPDLTVIGANPMMSNSYIVTFDANGGYFWNPENTTWSTFVSQGDELQAEPDAMNGNLAFAGWYLDTNFEGDPIMPWGYVPTGDVTFYAKWAEGVMVTFSANGGYFWDPNETTWSIRTPKGATCTVYGRGPVEPKRDDGQVFAGWYDNAACDGDPVDPWNYTPTYQTDVTFYVKWETRITVTFDANGGYFSDPSETIRCFQTLAGSTTVSYPGIPVRDDGYKFVGWYDNSACTGEMVYPTNYAPTYQEDITFYASWEEGVPVTLDANGGYFFGDPDQTTCIVTAAKGSMTVEYPLPQRDHYCFVNYYDNPDGNGDPVYPEYYEQTYQVPVVFYAKWEPVEPQSETYTVTYNANGGYFRDDPTFTSFTNTVAAGASATGAFWSYEYNSTDHTMVGGWYYDPECTQFVMGSLGSFIPTEDVTLYAKWVAAAVITYDANGGYLYGNPSVSISDGYHMPIGQPMYGNNVLSADREGYTFAGWCLDAGGTGDVVDMYNYTPTADVTFYAKWIDLVNVTFNANGGLLIFGDGEFSVRTVQIEKGSPLNCIGIPITRREGMALEGWYLDADFQNGPINEDTYVFTSDVTFYAKWAESWTVTFNGNGGYIWGQSEVPTYSVSVIRGGVVEYVPSVEHPDGLTFAGWYDNAACTGDAVDVYTCIITGDVTFYAKWVSAEPEPETYTVTWDGNGGYFDNEHTVTFVTEQVVAGNATTMNPYVESADGTAVVENWYFNPECTGTPVFTGPGGYTPTADITIYARLTYTYKVLMNPNGGYILDGSNEIWANIREDRAFYGSDYVNLFGHSNPNMIIEGWYFDAACTNLACSCIEGDEIRFFYPTEAVTVYAKWVNNTVTVVFDANGGYFNGNETDTQMTGYRQRGSVLDSNIPSILSRPGWNLAEDPWYLDAACTNGPVDLSTYVLNNDVTFYAKWIEVEPEAQPDGLMSNLDRGAANVPGEGNEEDENGILVTEEDGEPAADAGEAEGNEPVADAGVIEGNEPAADAGETEGNEPGADAGVIEGSEPVADVGEAENLEPNASDNEQN